MNLVLANLDLVHSAVVIALLAILAIAITPRDTWGK